MFVALNVVESKDGHRLTSMHPETETTRYVVGNEWVR